MKLFTKILLAILFFNLPAAAQVTGLSGWNIYIDPGHHGEPGDENVGIYGYSEAHKVLRVGLALREYLLNETDIDTVYMSRTNDQQYITLSQRTDKANSIGAAWYHSIHSDAGGPTANSTLLLHGGWRENGQIVEKIPIGGKAMSDIMVDILSRGYRIPTRGNYADRTFYSNANQSYRYPYLHVNRETTMPSELSEAGFHTNPVQNTRNMNEDWKKLEARTFYWSILKYHKIERPFVGICTGIVENIESGIPINGAVVTIEDKSYTTDTYKSVFNNYSNDPNQLHNGFYFIDSLDNIDSVMISVSALGYDVIETKVALNDTFFTFQDFQLVSKENPRVISLSPASTDSLYPGENNIQISFSRPMDIASVEQSIKINPPANVVFSWKDNDQTLVIETKNLSFNTIYEFTIEGTALDNYNHQLDGNADSTGGDSFIFTIKTRYPDNLAPSIEQIYPAANSIEVELQPIITIVFSEKVNTSTVSGKIKVERNSDQSSVTGIFKHYIINNKSVFILSPNSELQPEEVYSIKISAGIEDLYKNAVTETTNFSFTTGNQSFVIKKIDDFEGGFTSNWWEPQQSGSTKGILTFQTTRSENTSLFNYITKGQKSMQIDYGWDTAADLWLIREYLSGGTPKNVYFDKSYILQTYLFGDGKGNKFRFSVHKVGQSPGLEVSPWFNVDWYGWKLVSWDLTNDSVGTWIGNGSLDGNLQFDSYQLSYNSGKDNIGTYYLDDLRVVQKVTVGISKEDNQIPGEFSLRQNYPNPFNPSTKISYSLPEETLVTLKVYNILGSEVAALVNERQSAGNYSINFDAHNLASGVYIYRLAAGKYFKEMKMLLIK